MSAARRNAAAHARRQVVHLVAVHALGDDAPACHDDLHAALVDALPPREQEWLDDTLDACAAVAAAEADPVHIDGDDVLPPMTAAEIDAEIAALVVRALDDADAPAPAGRAAAPGM